MAGLAIFDVDHTLTRRSTGARFVLGAIGAGLLPRRVALTLPWYATAYRLGILSQGRERRFPGLAGVPRDRLEQVADDCFRARMLGDLYPEAVAAVRERQAAGHRVVLATSSLDVIVAPLARYLGVTDVIASALEFHDGRCTGRVAGSVLLGAEKHRRVLRFIAAAGERPESCSFWSDSSYDLPLLEAVGEPVAVCPDLRLRRVARARGWPIRDFR
jgi:HAD superfamily hydrolase (TIGR01490 family)